MNPTPISPQAAAQLCAVGAILIDVRDPSEHAREHIPGAHNVPLTALDRIPPGHEAYVFHCRSGMRTAAHGDALAAAVGDADCYVLKGGIDAWRTSGLATLTNDRAPLEIMRQVQIVAGGLVLLGVLTGLLVTPAFFAIAAFVGAGLTFAGVTGWCGMARILAVLPWNRSAATC